LYTSEHLPDEAKKVVVKAHGGFTVDRRPGKGETYFALPGAGIIQISGDLKTIRVLDTADAMKNTNMHNATIWYTQDGTPYLVFPANDAGKVFTTTLDGKLVHTLDAPTGEDISSARRSAITSGSRQLCTHGCRGDDDPLLHRHGYSKLDYVLTARIWHRSSRRCGTSGLGGRATRMASSRRRTVSPYRQGPGGWTLRIGHIPASSDSAATVITSPRQMPAAPPHIYSTNTPSSAV
jgi:hypothetical protein